MKNFRVLFSVTVLLFSVIFSSWVSAESIKIGWEPWAPYQYKNKEHKLTGLDIDLARAIVQKAGYKAIFTERPWKRQLLELASGSLDALLGASKTTKRKKYAYFSDSYRKESVVFYVLKGNFSKMKGKLTSLKGLADLNYNVGVVRGYYYGEEYALLIKQAKYKKYFKNVINDATNFRKILSNRLDGIIVDPVVATAIMKKNGWIGKIVPLFNVYSDDIYIMLSKKGTTTKEVKNLNNSLKALRANGEYQKIIDRYIQR